jgi:hypothetical protein
MADPKPPSTPKFYHDGKPVFVLIPQNQGYSKICQSALEGQFDKLEVHPDVVTELKIRQLPPDSILYLMHPIKVKKKDTRGKVRTGVETFLSAPIDIFKDASDSNKKGYRTLNQNLLVQLVTRTCQSDPAGLFFRGTITGESTKNPDGLLLKISEQ